MLKTESENKIHHFWLEPNRVLFYLTHGHRPMHCTAGGWNHIIVFIYIVGPAGTQISNVLTLDFLFFFSFFFTIEYIQSNMHWSFPDPSLSILELLQKYPNLDAFTNQIIPKDSTQLARPQISNLKNTSWPTRIASTRTGCYIKLWID